MRVLAARFADRRIASAVGEVLRRELDLAAPDLGIAPLASTTEDRTTDETVLAGRFDDRAAAEVAKLVRDAGGEIIANVDEQWTRPRTALDAGSWGSSLGKDRLHA